MTTKPTKPTPPKTPADTLRNLDAMTTERFDRMCAFHGMRAGAVIRDIMDGLTADPDPWTFETRLSMIRRIATHPHPPTHNNDSAPNLLHRLVRAASALTLDRLRVLVWAAERVTAPH